MKKIFIIQGRHVLLVVLLSVEYYMCVLSSIDWTIYMLCPILYIWGLDYICLKINKNYWSVWNKFIKKYIFPLELNPKNMILYM